MQDISVLYATRDMPAPFSARKHFFPPPSKKKQAAFVVSPSKARHKKAYYQRLTREILEDMCAQVRE